MDLHISLAAETIFTIFGFPVTNTLFTSWIIVAFLVLATFVVRKSFVVSPAQAASGIENSPAKTNPTRFSVLIETIFSTLFGFFNSLTGSESKTKRYFPIVATIFLFVIFSNWFGIFPGMGSISVKELYGDGNVSLIPVLRTVFSDLNMTLAIALIAVVLSHVYGIRKIGKKHIGKYFNFSNPILFFVGILELVGEIAKIISFSFRLFGNIFAGEVLLVVIAALLPFIMPLPFMGLELFVGFMQALIFATLTAVFLSSAEESHDH